MINYNRKQNKENAEKHEQLINKIFKKQIEDSITNTKLYDRKNVKPSAGKFNANVLVQNLDTYNAAVKAFKTFKGSKIAVLNFADYRDAGGGYLRGSMAQEEAICGQSTLYPVISKQKDYYAYNEKHMNHGIYLDRALYSPSILWGTSTRPLAKTDVITCAAPRKSRGKYMKNAQAQTRYYKEADEALEKRMEFVKQIAETEKVDVLILGAWGAGAFGFDARSVAEMWKRVFSKPTSIKQVIFAIINDKRSNQAYTAFEEAFK